MKMFSVFSHRGKCKSKLQWVAISHPSGWLYSKEWKTPGAGKDMYQGYEIPFRGDKNIWNVTELVVAQHC